MFQGEHQLDRKIRPAKIVDQATYLSYLDEISQWEVKPTGFFLNMDGEPLQDPLFCDRMKALHQYGYGQLSSLQTNGQLLDEAKAHAILDAGIATVVFGFDGATKEVYEKHRVRCNYERVLSNIKMFVSLRDSKKSPTQIQIKYVRTKLNAHEARAAYNLFNPFMSAEKDLFQDVMAIDWSNTPTSDDGDIYYNKKVVGRNATVGCELLQDQMIVLCDGRLASCCFDYNLDVSGGGYPIGEASLLEAWRSDKRASLVKKLLSENAADKPPQCRNCPAHYKFKMLERQDPAVPEALCSESDVGFSYNFGKAATHNQGKRFTSASPFVIPDKP